MNFYNASEGGGGGGKKKIGGGGGGRLLSVSREREIVWGKDVSEK